MSLAAEEVLEQAANVLPDEKPRHLLADTDPFWIRCRYVGEK